MKKVTTKLDFQTANNFLEQMARNGDNGQLKRLPEHILEIFKKDNALLPRHLNFGLFKELLIDQLLALQPNYKVDQYSGSIIEQISKYYTEDEGSLNYYAFRFSKGLLIMGKVGCGKTLIIKALAMLLRSFIWKFDPNHRVIHLDTNYFPAYLITENFIKSGYDWLSRSITEGLVHERTPKVYGENLFIDDIGSENIVSSFGNTTNVIGELILRRYDTEKTIYATTNLDPQSLKVFYGERVYSRMTEMLNFIVMEGEDRRR